jgi:hypothetical protein
MMDTLTFLQRVLPSTGIYATAVLGQSGMQHRFFSKVEDLARAIVTLDGRGNNTYYAISAFCEPGSRTQENTRCTKVLPLDVDCGPTKPFPTWKEGLLALGKFVSDAKLPKPLVIHSGNGLHVYWVLTEELEPARWQPLANALKAKVVQHQFAVKDLGLTANSALVLRPTGTRNPKNNNEVRLLVDAPLVDVSTMAQVLDLGAAPPPAVAPRPPSQLSKLTQALQVQSDIPPAVPIVVLSKCQQVQWAVRNPSEVPEPLWYDLIGVAAFCEDPEATALKWSEGHPSFDPNETVRKLHHWQKAATGPTTCAKFDTDRPGGCKGCKYKDKIGSPARLGVQYQEVAPPANAPQQVVVEIPMPKPFKRTADGIKLTVDDTDVDVCRFDVFPVSYGRDEGLGYETVRYMWNRPHAGWKELSLRQAYLTTSRLKEFTTEIADQGIVLPGVKPTEYFQIMLRSYMDELRQRRAMTNLYTTMGWKENFTQFVIGNLLLRRQPDGSVSEENIQISSTSTRLGHDLYDAAGNLDAWVDFTRLIEKTNLHAHAFALGVGFSAPLYAFTGLKGLTVSLYGPTGGGKTLAQFWIQSMWGSPEKLHFAAKFTQATFFSRLGMYSNMPMTIDEATMIEDKDMGDFAYWVSQGRDKARLNRNAEERDAKTWATPVIVSTNKSLQSKLIASGLDTEAQMMRILEVTTPPHPMFTRNSEAGRRIYEFLTANYGHAGPTFVARLLEMGADGVRAMITEATATFPQRYQCKFHGEERFWEQAIVLADLALNLAKEWGLIQFDHRPGIEWVLSQVGAIRRSVTEGKLDAFDMLGDYLNDTADTAVTVMHTGTAKPIVDFSRLPRGEIRVRFDVYRRTASETFSHGVMLLDRTHLRRWLSSKGLDYKTFIQELTDDHAIATPASKKAYLGKDTPIKLAQTYVVGVNLSHPRMQGILDEADRDYENLAFGKLAVVPQSV